MAEPLGRSRLRFQRITMVVRGLGSKIPAASGMICRASYLSKTDQQ